MLVWLGQFFWADHFANELAEVDLLLEEVIAARQNKVKANFVSDLVI